VAEERGLAEVPQVSLAGAIHSRARGMPGAITSAGVRSPRGPGRFRGPGLVQRSPQSRRLDPDLCHIVADAQHRRRLLRGALLLPRPPRAPTGAGSAFAPERWTTRSNPAGREAERGPPAVPWQARGPRQPSRGTPDTHGSGGPQAPARSHLVNIRDLPQRAHPTRAASCRIAL
jgi:hypothetical protein